MPFWALHIHLVLFMMLSLAFTGCSKIQVQVKEIPGSLRGLEVGDGISVVLVYQGGSVQKAEKLEKSIGDCMADAMQERNLSVKFIPPGEFRRAVFANTDITSAPRPRAIHGLLNSPQFCEKTKSLNLRYLITVREGTWSDEQVLTWQGPFGVVDAKNTELVADIIDLQRATGSGEVHVTVSDKGVYACVYIFPVVVPAFTEGRACKTLGRTVTKFLLGEKNGELSK